MLFQRRLVASRAPYRVDDFSIDGETEFQRVPKSFSGSRTVSNRKGHFWKTKNKGRFCGQCRYGLVQESYCEYAESYHSTCVTCGRVEHIYPNKTEMHTRTMLGIGTIFVKNDHG